MVTAAKATLTRILTTQGRNENPTQKSLTLFAEILNKHYQNGYDEGIAVANSDWP